LDEASDPFAAIVALTRDRERQAFGAGFVFTHPDDDEDHFTSQVERCFFRDVLGANGAGKLTPIFCAFDANWIDAIDPDRDGFGFERPTTIGGGGPNCPFRFRRSRLSSPEVKRPDSFCEPRCFAMAERKAAKKGAPKSAASAARKGSTTFTAEERAAMREHANEVRAAARRGPRASEADGESDVLEKIAEMPEQDRVMAERLHALIKASAPVLSPRTWYGMPAYAKDGNVVCFFQPAQKFKSRYSTLGFSDKANLDEDAMWPTSFALKELTAADEERIAALVKKAVG
jgi:uncharacterized protein YdhG (YjbR/CyaY superfamily)